MKTRKGWNNSERNLDEYLHVGDVIDEGLYNYIAEVVAPAYCIENFVQCGEPYYHREEISFHMTACFQDGKYYYLGILPLFK